jgi:hypothetical protein
MHKWHRKETEGKKESEKRRTDKEEEYRVDSS